MAFDPITGKLWMTENGPNSYDEINMVEPGFNSGWEQILGPDNRDPNNVTDLFQLPGSHYSDPKFSWLSPVGPTGIVFLHSTALGAQYQFDTFVGDINNGNLYRFRPNTARDGFIFGGAGLADLVADNAAELDEVIFGTGFNGITDLKVGPDGRLYVISFLAGKIYVISSRMDTTAPDTSITSGPSGTTTVNSPTFSWTGTDNVTATANLVYASRLDPVEPGFSAFGSAITKSYSNLANGNYTFYVKAKDQAGNEDLTPASQAFTVNVTSQWTFCADENQFCSFSGTKLVRYGANGIFNFQTAINGISCNNGTFGDPIFGTVKHCEYTDTTTSWTLCADENQLCSFSGTKLVRYGANGIFNFQTVTNGISCNNATFGDPILGTVKHCDYTDTTTMWSFCADENQFCSFTGTKLVRYGANGIFSFQTATNGISCNNTTFGDPIFGTVKQCEYTDTSILAAESAR